MSITNSTNYSGYSPLMLWATADTDLFNRTHVANTAQSLEQHVHGGAARGTGLSVLNLNSSASTNTALANAGDVLLTASAFTYKDGSANTHTLAQLDDTNTYAAGGVQDFSAQTGANSFKVPSIAGAAPTQAAALAYNSTTNSLVYGNGTTTVNLTAGQTGTLSAAGFGTTDPTGGFLCDGRAISRTTYATLFGKVSTTYGTGDGSTTFNIPDLRSRVPMGADNMGTSAGAASRTSSNNALGNTSGADTSTALIAHSHTDSGHTHSNTLTDPKHDHSTSGADSGSTGGNGGAFFMYNGNNAHTLATDTGTSTGITINNVSAAAVIGSSGSGSSYSLRNLNQVVSYIIWY